jgi:hypothetical protein
MTDPVRQMAQPNLPSVPNSSFKKYAPKTALVLLSMCIGRKHQMTLPY